jgi:mannose-6-phosphate isomerase-like protein (cupin superfamily)
MASADVEPISASPTFERRPWGTYAVLEDGDDCKVKRITVDPGQRLSYQSHARRAEHWVMVAGTATVTIDGTDHTIEPGGAVDIPLGAAHRIANHGAEPLVFIEVQLGDYFGEDDIVRYSDDYGRAE